MQNPLEINKNPENTELMHIDVKDENQLKDLMDDEEYEEFVKNLEQQQHERAIKHIPFASILTGEPKKEEAKTADAKADASPAAKQSEGADAAQNKH